MKSLQAFSRGLSDEFVGELRSGRFAPLLSAALRSDLDIQIRKDYLNIYHNGLSILALSNHVTAPRFRARIHRKYLNGVKLGHQMVQVGDYRRFDANREFIESFRVIEQKQSLGLLPRHVCLPDDQAPVQCLLVLHGYNPRSRLLARLRNASVAGSSAVALAMLPKGTYTLPPATAWEALCPAK